MIVSISNYLGSNVHTQGFVCLLLRISIWSGEVQIWHNWWTMIWLEHSIVGGLCLSAPHRFQTINGHCYLHANITRCKTQVQNCQELTWLSANLSSCGVHARNSSSCDYWYCSYLFVQCEQNFGGHSIIVIELLICICDPVLICMHVTYMTVYWWAIISTHFESANNMTFLPLHRAMPLIDHKNLYYKSILLHVRTWWYM